MASLHEIFDAMISTGTIDIHTAASMSQICKDTHMMFNDESRQKQIIEGDTTSDVMWLARNISDTKDVVIPSTISGVKSMLQSHHTIDETLCTKILHDKHVFDDDNRFNLFMKTCFHIDPMLFTQGIVPLKAIANIMKNILHSCIEYFCTNKEQNKDDLDMKYKKYTMYVSMLSRIIEFAIRNKQLIRNAPRDDVKILINPRLMNVIIMKNKQFLTVDNSVNDILDPVIKKRFKDVLSTNIKIMKGWKEAWFYGYDVGIGSCGGVYKISRHTSKRIYYRV